VSNRDGGEKAGKQTTSNAQADQQQLLKQARRDEIVTAHSTDDSEN